MSEHPRCSKCGLRIAIDPYGGSRAWVHLSKKANIDHWAVLGDCESES